VLELRGHYSLAVSAAAVALSFTSLAARADDITIGFVTHAQGNPFVEQIVDGAKAAAADLRVTLKVQESPGGSPEGQLKLAQGLSMPALPASPRRCPATQWQRA
jgi:ABC-type sugar transport system substrate-binding protein